jgi:hypothetical protein
MKYGAAVSAGLIRFGLVLLLTIMAFPSVDVHGQVSPQFFAVSTSTTADLPKVPYGYLGHPGPLVWSTVETSRGVYQWQKIDAFVKKAPIANGIALIDLVLGFTPGWAVANQTHCRAMGTVTVCTVPPDNQQDWVNFVTALVAHYNGTTAPHVAFYEVWNEANNAQCWTGTVAQLASMGAAAYPILKTDPYSQVLTPSLVWDRATGPEWTAQYLTLAPADGVTFHAYTSQTGPKNPRPVPMPESSLSTNAPLQTMIAAWQEQANGLPVLVTEGGWGVQGVSDPDQQAAWLAHYFVIGASSGGLQLLSWFEWGVPSLALSGNIENTNRTPNEAGVALEVIQPWLESGPLTPCSASGTVWSCQAGSNLILWDDSQTCSGGVCTTNDYPTSGSGYYDLTGAFWPIQNGEVPLGLKPVMVVQ